MPLLDAGFLEGVKSFMTDGREIWICEVQNQDKTNCCYAFASSDSIYSLQYLLFGKAEKVSVQEFFDRLHEIYAPNYAEYNENGEIVYIKEGYGNSAKNAFRYASIYGISFDSEWPFKYEVSSTSEERDQLDYIIKNGRRLFLSGYHRIPDGDHVQVRQRLNEQPVTTLVLATVSLKKWKPANGVYLGPTEEEMAAQNEAQERGTDPPYRNHVMLLVGYGDDSNDRPYFLAKDSNGLESGYLGFYKIAPTACRAFMYPFGCKIKEPETKKGAPSKKAVEKNEVPSKKPVEKNGVPSKKPVEKNGVPSKKPVEKNGVPSKKGNKKK